MCSQSRRLVLLVALLGSPALLSAQTPGSGWAIQPGPARVVKTLYWQLFDQTEVWTLLTPKDAQETRALPFNLVFSATFKGDLKTAEQRVARGPMGITLTALPSPVAAFPIPSLSFVLVTDDGHTFDLVANGMATRPVSVGDTCCSETIVAQIDRPTLRAVARSKKVTGHILGLDSVLDEDDMKAVSEFARSVLPPETTRAR